MSDAVMVPREPTEAEIKAVHGAFHAPAPAYDRTTNSLDRMDLLARNIARAVIAASPSVGGWEDISTAPKDGTMLLVAYDDGVARAGAMEDHQRVYEARWNDFQGTWSARNGFLLHSDATHWMPLPPPPSVSIDKGSRPQEAVPTEQADGAVVSGHTPQCWGRTSYSEEVAHCYCPTTPQPAEGCSEKPVLSDRREMAKGVAPRTDPVLVLRETCQRLLDDYQTSEAHHPNHVLVLKADFEALRKAAEGCSSNEGAGGWIEWSGGENPVPGQMVVARTVWDRDTGRPARKNNILSDKLDWGRSHRQRDFDIIAYRILPQTEKGS